MNEENKQEQNNEEIAAEQAPRDDKKKEIAELKQLGITGKKIGMTQIFDEQGDVVPVTAIQIAENVVTGIKSKEKHGYDAVQIGNFETRAKRLNKPKRSYLEKQNLPLFKKLKEFRIKTTATAEAGDAIDTAKFFEGAEKLNLTATSIGKGFQGGVKLHNMSVGRRSHGSKSKRQIGSLGAGTDPSRVFPGKRMPAQMGNRTVTVTKAKFVNFDAESKILLVKGPVPGKPGASVTIRAYGQESWNTKNKEQLAAAVK